jgi:hypothetical protein
VDVAPGATGSGNAGIYLNSDATITVTLEGEDAANFTVVRVETYDVVSDPDSPPGRPPILVLQLSSRVNGPGPIDVAEGQAFLTFVEFACPSDPPKAHFTAVAAVKDPSLPAGIALPVSATARVGRLTAQLLSVVAVSPGLSAPVLVRISSSFAHDVPIRVVYEEGFQPLFSAASQPATVPAGDHTDVGLSLTCRSDAPLGDLVARFEMRSSDLALLYGEIVITVSVIPRGSVSTTLETTAVTITSGGTAPLIATMRAVDTISDVDVTFAVEDGNAGLTVSSPSAIVKPNASARVAIWLVAPEDASGSTAINLVQSSFSGRRTDRIDTPVSVSFAQPPASEDFIVYRIYWGPKWQTGKAFLWAEMEQAISNLLQSDYVRGLREYGVRQIFAPGNPQPIIEDSFVEPFNNSDLTNLIVNLINLKRLPRPDADPRTPYYAVIPQNGSHYAPNPDGLCGRHDTFNFEGTDQLYSFTYQGGDVGGTISCFAHEMAEALSAKRAQMEIADPCERLIGMTDGVLTEAYFSKRQNLCVIPGATDPDVAATPAIPGKTGS